MKMRRRMEPLVFYAQSQQKTVARGVSRISALAGRSLASGQERMIEREKEKGKKEKNTMR